MTARPIRLHPCPRLRATASGGRGKAGAIAGLLVGDAAGAAARVVVETWPADADEPAQRVSLHPGEGLRLSRALVRLVDELTFNDRVA